MSTDPQDPSAGFLRQWQDHGDPEALNRLLQLEVTVLKHMIRGRRDAAHSVSAGTSDIAQEAVMGLLKTKSAPHFDDPRSLRGYLWKSAWHLLVQSFEKKKAKPLDLDAGESPALDRFIDATGGLQNLEATERTHAIALAMNLLKLQDRELLRLVYFEKKDLAAAAQIVGLSRDAANSRLVRARRLFASTLADWAELIG